MNRAIKGARGAFTSPYPISPSLINVKRHDKIFSVICELRISPTLQAVPNV